MTAIIRDEGVRSGDPRIEGTRITVFDIKRRVIEGDEDPFAVATEYDLNIGAVFAALAYYYENVETMHELEDEKERLRREIQKRSPKPSDFVGDDTAPEPS